MPFFLFVKKLCFGVGACSHSRCVWLLTRSHGIIFRVFFLSFMSCWPSRLDCYLQTFRKFIWYPYPRSHAYAYLTASPNPFFLLPVHGFAWPSCIPIAHILGPGWKSVTGNDLWGLRTAQNPCLAALVDHTLVKCGCNTMFIGLSARKAATCACAMRGGHDDDNQNSGCRNTARKFAPLPTSPRSASYPFLSHSWISMQTMFHARSCPCHTPFRLVLKLIMPTFHFLTPHIQQDLLATSLNPSSTTFGLSNNDSLVDAFNGVSVL